MSRGQRVKALIESAYAAYKSAMTKVRKPSEVLLKREEVQEVETRRARRLKEQSALELMKDWGYYPLAKAHPDSPGYTGLLVAIRKEPTDRHFDPHTLHLRLRDEYGLASWRTLSWLSPLQRTARACVGPVTLRDRFDRRVDFFTFGGSLEMTPEPGVMVYALRSPAPVLELVDQQETIQDQLASETQELLGEIEVRWGPDERGFSRRLAELDPLRFYMATLELILSRYEHARALEEAYHPFYAGLRREKEWLVANGQWPAKLPALVDLLAPA